MYKNVRSDFEAFRAGSLIRGQCKPVHVQPPAACVPYLVYERTTLAEADKADLQNRENRDQIDACMSSLGGKIPCGYCGTTENGISVPGAEKVEAGEQPPHA